MTILIDIKANGGNTKGKIFVVLFRLSGFFSRSPILRIIGLPVRLIYKVVIEWFLGIELPDQTIVGAGLKLVHGQGLVVNRNTKIGTNVTLRQNTTIGNSKSGGACPVIGDNVNVGANCVIIGGITIGSGSIIGAGSVVVKDLPPNSVVVGNPARIVRIIS